METTFNTPKNLSELSEIDQFNSMSSFGIYCFFKDNNYQNILISFDGGYSYTQIRNFSHFTEYLNFHQAKQPTEKVFFLYEGKNRFLALLESNQSFTVTL
jgi:hypothetical protein